MFCSASISARRISAKIPGIIFCLIILLCPLVHFDDLYNSLKLPRQYLLVTSLVLMGSYSLLFRKESIFIAHPFIGNIFFLTLFSLSSLIWAASKYDVLNSSTQLITGSLAILAVTSFCRTNRMRNSVILTIIAVGLLSALLGISQYYCNTTLFPQRCSPASFFGNKNMGSHIVAMILPLFLLFPLIRPLKPRRIYSFAGILLLSLPVNYIYFARTRAAWAALIVASLFFLFGIIRSDVLRKRFFAGWGILKTTAKVLAVLFIAMVGIPLLVKNFKKEAVTTSTFVPRNALSSKTLSIRKTMWKNSLPMIKASPLIGHGMGNFKIFYPLFHKTVVEDLNFSEKRQPQNVHNDFIQKFVELGLIGFISFVFIFISFYYMVYKVLKKSSSPESGLMALLIGTGGTVYVIVANFSFPMECATITFFFFTLYGVLFSLYAETTTLSDNMQPLVCPLFLRVIIVIPLSLISIGYYSFSMLSDYYYGKTLSYAAHSRWEETIAAGEKSYSYNKWNVEVLKPVAWAQIAQRKYENVTPLLERVITSKPYDITALKMLAKIYDKSGNRTKLLETKATLKSITD